VAQGDVIVTVVGNITGDPELRFTQSGAAVANFTVVKNRRRLNQQTQQWEDAGADFYRVNVWRQLAENITESLRKGDRVMVCGKLESRDFETREGEKRISWEITADAVGPDLRFATAQVRKADRQQGGYSQQGGQGGGYGGPPQDDPWSRSQGQQQRSQGQQQPANNPNDPWGPPAGQQQSMYGGSGFNDEPPF
jgi:single-strand DNA-binding protein